MTRIPRNNYWRISGSSVDNVMIPTFFSPAYVAPTPSTSMRKLGEIARIIRERKTATLIPPVRDPIPAIMKTHDPGYVERFLRGEPGSGNRFGADAPFGTWLPAIRNGVLAIHGGNLEAVAMAIGGEPIVANIAQGFHHARYERGAGYCTFNGFAVAAKAFPEQVFAVLDVDEHEGDGTNLFAKRIPNLFNATIHGTEIGIPPCSKTFLRRSRNNPKQYLQFVEEAIAWILDKDPDVVFYNAGMDCHEDDDCGYANLDEETLRQRDLLAFSSFVKAKKPVVFAVAGGYQSDLQRIASIHAGTWDMAVAALSKT